MAGYLFVHFIGEQKDGEQVYFSVSKDGLNWNDLNDGKPVLVSKIGEKGVRDPFIVRDEVNNKFYLIATDLRIEAGKGWEAASGAGSRNLIVWESFDLVNWSEERAVTVGVENAGCVWAPESVYDKEKEAFFVFWASRIKLEKDESSKQRIYAAYTRDFKEFSEPFVYFEAENHVIDSTIVWEDGWYYRFTKDETTKTIRLDRSKNLAGKDYEKVSSPVLDNFFGLEGPECYKLPDGRWCLIADQFAAKKGYLPFISSNLAGGEFEVAEPESYNLGKTLKRHGGVIKLTDEEYERLWNMR